MPWLRCSSGIRSSGWSALLSGAARPMPAGAARSLPALHVVAYNGSIQTPRPIRADTTLLHSDTRTHAAISANGAVLMRFMWIAACAACLITSAPAAAQGAAGEDAHMDRPVAQAVRAP